MPVIVLAAPPLTAVISISGRAPAAAEAALAGLLPLVEGRLRELRQAPVTGGGYRLRSELLILINIDGS